MTSKLRCPFCGKKLWYDEQDGIYRCMKSACVMDYEGATEQLWQALTQAKQDLEIARQALEEIDALLLSHKFDITELGRLNIIQYLVSRALKLTEHKETINDE